MTRPKTRGVDASGNLWVISVDDTPSGRDVCIGSLRSAAGAEISKAAQQVAHKVRNLDQKTTFVMAVLAATHPLSTKLSVNPRRLVVGASAADPQFGILGVCLPEPASVMWLFPRFSVTLFSAVRATHHPLPLFLEGTCYFRRSRDRTLSRL